MGDVYLSRRSGLADIERYCVLKVLETGREFLNDLSARFLDEARVVVLLNHQNICNVFDVDQVDGDLYLAMDYVAGRDLAALLNRQRELGEPLAPALALMILCEVLKALDYAHRLKHPTTGEPLGIVHRDVSHQNVLVSFEGEVKLIDFGLAISTLKQQHTGDGFVLGTIGYMAPEQARGEQVGNRADLYAVGVMAYELLTGEHFYGGVEPTELVDVVGRGGHTPQRWGEIDQELAGLLQPALHASPESRYASCALFRQVLEGYQQQRALFAHADDLGSLMKRLFPDGEEEHRALLARHAAPTTIADDSQEVLDALDEIDDRHIDAMFTKPERSSAPAEQTAPLVPAVVPLAAVPPRSDVQPDAAAQRAVQPAAVAPPAAPPPARGEPTEMVVVRHELYNDQRINVTREAFTQRKRRWRFLLAGTSVIALICLAGTGYLLLTRDRDPAVAGAAGADAGMLRPTTGLSPGDAAARESEDASRPRADAAREDARPTSALEPTIDAGDAGEVAAEPSRSKKRRDRRRGQRRRRPRSR